MAAPNNSAKINTLADGVTAQSGDQIPVNRAGADAYITPGYIQTMIGAQPSSPILTSLAGLTFAVGDIVYASGAAALTNLADVATGNVLRAGGIGVAPAWGKVGLTTDVTGILPSANGGTGVNNAGTLTNAMNTTITGGGTLALAGFTLTVPSTGSAALLAIANVFTLAQTVQRDAIGASTTDGLILTNTTAAAAGAQQWSPRLRFTGQGWKTNATAASQTVDWIIENRPVQGAANPSLTLVIASQINGGGYVDLVTFAPLATGITFAAGLFPNSSGTRDFGSSGARWKDSWFSGAMTARTIIATATTVADTMFIARGIAAQTSNLQEWQDSGNNNLSSISENGYHMTRKVAAPADGELASSELAYWFDATNGAGKFMVKAKTADGTVVTGSVTLA